MKYVKLFEEFTPNTVTCENCAWQWKMQDGGKDVFVCHECGHDNSPKFMNESEEKAKGDRGPIDNDAIETGLKNKAKESGVPLALLRLVMRRGMDAWNSGHQAKLEETVSAIEVLRDINIDDEIANHKQLAITQAAKRQLNELTRQRSSVESLLKTNQKN